MFGSNKEIPEKPQKQRDQIDALWEACFNHIPTQLNILGLKINFVLIFIGLILAFLAALLVLVVRVV